MIRKWIVEGFFLRITRVQSLKVMGTFGEPKLMYIIRDITNYVLIASGLSQRRQAMG